MKEIPLTQGKVAIVDDEDFDKLNKFKWYAHKNGNVFYAIRNDRSSGKHKTVPIHRQVLNITQNTSVDHVNGNGLDNRKCNLRVCNNVENLRNRCINKNNSSGYKGVYWDSSANKWKVEITYNRKIIKIGRFRCIIKAAKAYNEAAIKYHGEFARLNIV